MITTVLLKTKMALAFAWIKHNWKTIGIGLAMAAVIGYGIFTKRKNDELVRSLQKALEDSRKDFDKASENHRQEILRRDLIEEKYKKVIVDLTEKYGEAVAKVDREKSQAIRQIITDTQDNPRIMASRLNMVLGIPLYENGERP